VSNRATGMHKRVDSLRKFDLLGCKMEFGLLIAS
jgi:hypothetical protein